MKAMILAAGFGTRLSPHTKNLPKALVPYKGIPMIKHQIERLKKIDIDEIVVNTHHNSKMILDYFKANDFNIKINVVVEQDILGTGGGILNAADFFKDEKNFIVINVDVDTDMDISRMIEFHKDNQAFATLAVQKRPTTRYLEFDDKMNLVGIGNEKSNRENLFAFNGIHLISNRIFNKGYEITFRGILEIYFDLVKNKNENILGYNAGKSSFKDLGKIENLFT